MIEDSHDRPGTRRGVLVWTILVGVLTTLVALYALRGAAELPPAELAAPAEAPPSDEAVALPHEPPDLPPGPHREDFLLSCTICHSTRLVVNQPPFPQKKWAEEVHKMVTAYGAPIAPDDEPRIVEYLMILRGRPE
jgi:cytochrome c5